MSKLLISFLALLLSVTWTQAQDFYYKPYSKASNKSVGGSKDIDRLIFVEFQYPKAAVNQGIEGSVSFSFKLLPNGKVDDLKVKNSPSELLTVEAKRLFKKIQWSKDPYRPVHMNLRDEFTLKFSLKKWVRLYKKRGYTYHDMKGIEVDTSQKIYFIKAVEEKPTPIFKDGSYNSFNHYIARKMRYPETAIKLNLKGEVVVAFVIEPSGQITNIEVRKGMNGGCTQEALRLIKNVTWQPAKHKGVAVRTQMLTAIGFGMSSNAFYENYGSN